MHRLRLIPAWFGVMIAVSLAVIVYGSMAKLQPQQSSEIAAEANKEICLTDCLWLDTMPKDVHDSYQMYIFNESEGRYGISVKADSVYKMLIEVFEYIDLSKQNSIQFHFPHDGRKPSTGYVIAKMAKPDRVFTHQLTLAKDPQNAGSEKVYFTGPDLQLDTYQNSELPDFVKQSITNYLNVNGR